MCTKLEKFIQEVKEVSTCNLREYIFFKLYFSRSRFKMLRKMEMTQKTTHLLPRVTQPMITLYQFWWTDGSNGPTVSAGTLSLMTEKSILTMPKMYVF